MVDSTDGSGSGAGALGGADSSTLHSAVRLFWLLVFGLSFLLLCGLGI